MIIIIIIIIIIITAGVGHYIMFDKGMGELRDHYKRCSLSAGTELLWGFSS